jgi:hypothetical protein
MTNKLTLLFALPLLFLSACAQQSKIAAVTEEVIAFPGAEGFGKFATGGRGGQVYIVSNLEDSGEGSLRAAVNAKGPRIIVFSVSGTIHLKSPLSVKANTTIAGQTAPGDGICIADHPVSLSGDNIIFRYLRVRLGDRYQNTGKVPGAGHDDALSSTGRKHIIIDHCSISWSTDEIMSVYNGDSTTLQWNIISEPLNYSYHFEAGGTDFQEHGYGGIWGGRHLSAHHNLFAHCTSRTPRFNGTRQIGEELVDFTNNVIYNWGSNNVYAGEGGHYNISRNYYKYGPATKSGVKYRVANPFKKEPEIGFGKWYINENYVDGSMPVTDDNWLGVTMDKGDKNDLENAKSPRFPVIDVTVSTAERAYEDVLSKAGASFRRDTLDQRIINEVKNRTGRIIDVQGGYPHGTSYEQTVSAWPVLKSLHAPVDSDKDGMPDSWEVSKKLDPNDASDAVKNSIHKIYTNVEVYINSIQ